MLVNYFDFICPWSRLLQHLEEIFLRGLKFWNNILQHFWDESFQIAYFSVIRFGD